MLTLEFIKMQGNGNDFIVIDNRPYLFSNEMLSRLAAELCPRRRSVGADGLLVTEKSPDADFTMRIFNSDGSEAQMCGNGARCIARYAFEKGIAPAETSFSTKAGIVRAKVAQDLVTLDMGTVDLGEVGRKGTFPFEEGDISYTHLVVGVPHTTIFPQDTHDKTEADLRRLAQAIQADQKRFPESTNVNFITEVKEEFLRVITFERGVGDFTLSCGTGSAASAIAAWLEDLAKPPVTVKNPGGTNIVDFPDRRSLARISVKLTGKAEFVYEGRIPAPETEGKGIGG
ncbi:MAG: Diaminopimelate epimerase [Synergistales bacterium 53_16]|nr:MAG: Diaminopimelate epimerase [Synergistales bacterium 53_16]